MDADRWNSVNKLLERFMPLLTPSGVVLGFLLGELVVPIKSWGTFFFAFMTFTSALAINAGDLIAVFRRPFALIIFFFSFHIFQPLLIRLFAAAVIPHDAGLTAGLVLLFAIPAAVSSSIWVSMHNGNNALTIAIIVLDTLLAPVLTPYTVSLLLGSSIELDAGGMMLSLLWMVVLPSVLGIIVNQVSRGIIPIRILPFFRPISKIALLLVIMVNAGAIRSSVSSFDSSYIFAGILVILCSFLGFAAGRFSASLFRLPYADTVSLTFNCGLRNISAALVLAISFFEPRAGVPVIIGILFQQSIAGGVTQLLLKERID